jgi:hypothetical protein
MVTIRPNLVVTDWLRLKMIPLVYFKVNINFVLGHESWLGCYNKYGTYFAIFHIHLSRQSNDIFTTSRQAIGCYRFILMEDLFVHGVLSRMISTLYQGLCLAGCDVLATGAMVLLGPLVKNY